MMASVTAVELEHALRVALVSLGLFIAVLASAAVRARTTVRTFAAMSAVATAAYAVCTSGLPSPQASASLASLAWWTVAFLCAALPVIFWTFATAWFDDEFVPGAGTLAMIGLAGALGLLAVAFESNLLGGLRRVLAAALLMHLLWRLWRGAELDLVDERLRARRWVVGVGGLYVVGVILVELWLDGHAPPTHVQVVNLAGICLVMALSGLALCRWDLRDPPQPPSAPDKSAPVGPVPAAAPSRQAAADARIVSALQRAMREERLYRQEGLTVAALAAHLGTQEPRLRRVIRDSLGLRNFNELLHHYRLEEVAHRLSRDADDHLPILTLALEAGYASIGPFNRAFRSRFGVTPSAYRASAAGNRLDS